MAERVLKVLRGERRALTLRSPNSSALRRSGYSSSKDLIAPTKARFPHSKIQRNFKQRPTGNSSSKTARSQQRPQFHWADAILGPEWTTYCAAMEALRAAGIAFLLGGGFALATFTGRWRDTKDIDFYIMPENRTAAIAVLTRAGFSDYYDRRPYDRKWIYRSVRSGVIVDIIWAMANQRARVDAEWFRRASSVSVRGQQMLVLPKEEFLWCKLYILQRDHCDWTDIFNLLYSRGTLMDWAHLTSRLQEDLPLLKAALTVYGWLCPSRARRLPHDLWRQLELRPPPMAANKQERKRTRLLDSRAWFAAWQSKSQKLEV
jgi:hypothetical protein